MLRKDFAPSELVAITDEVATEIQKAAKRRQAHGKTALGRNASGNLPEASGDARDKIAERVGMSGQTFVRAKAVVDAAKSDPAKYAALVEEMDRTGRVQNSLARAPLPP